MKIDNKIKDKPIMACSKCWERTQTIYGEFPVFILKDNEEELLCYKALCPICGDLYRYNQGYFYRTICNSNILDFDMGNWEIVKKYNLDKKKLESFLLSDTMRKYLKLEELPKMVTKNSFHFGEPNYNDEVPF